MNGWDLDFLSALYFFLTDSTGYKMERLAELDDYIKIVVRRSSGEDPEISEINIKDSTDNRILSYCNYLNQSKWVESKKANKKIRNHDRSMIAGGQGYEINYKKIK